MNVATPVINRPFIFDPAALQEALTSRLNEPNGLSNFLGSPVTVQVIVPSTAEIPLYFNVNATPKATITVTWPKSDVPLTIKVPYPYNGVFLLHSKNNERGNCSKPAIWHWYPNMIGKPGLWFVRKYEQDGSGFENVIRLVLGNGVEYDAPLGKELVKVGKKKPSKGAYVPVEEWLKNFDKLPDNIQEHFLEIKKLLKELTIPIIRGTTYTELKTLFYDTAKSFIPNTNDTKCFFDNQDIRWQRLQSYSAFIADNLNTLIFRNVADCNDKRISSKADRWEYIVTKSNDLDVDWKLNRFISKKRNEGRLRLFNPLNGIHAISLLTAIKRYLPRDKNKFIGEAYRQNHPSFAGYICPVETPESDMVGITLHLTNEARTDALGNLSCSKDVDPEASLGFAANLIPFYQYNDSARSMMGAKNLVQALPVANAEPPMITTGHEIEVRDVLRPLADAGVLPGMDAFYQPGCDLLVAYMPWFGLNFDDAIVANERLRKVLDYSEEHVFVKYIPPYYKSVTPDVETTDYEFLAREVDTRRQVQNGSAQSVSEIYKSSYFVPENGPVHKNDTLAYFIDLSGQHQDIRILSPADGEFRFNSLTRDDERLGGILAWTLRENLPFGVGDKLMARHGNKGVVSVLLPSDQMPRLPDDPRLGDLSGRAVDLVLNPHGVISRMNLGQLIETHLGIVKHMGLANKFQKHVAAAFNEIDLQELKHSLLQINKGDTQHPIIDECGKMFLTFKNDGKEIRTESPVVVGFQYFLRLNHIPNLKAQTRGTGEILKYDDSTGGAASGKENQGGQRFGEMETWAVKAYQANRLLQWLFKDANIVTDENETDLRQIYRTVRDYFKAIDVNMIEKDEMIRIDWMRGKKGRLIQSPKSYQHILRDAVFGCPEPHCGSKLGYLSAFNLAHGETDKWKLTVGDVLRHCRLKIAKNMENKQLRPSKHRKFFEEKIKFINETNNFVEIPFQINIQPTSVAIKFEINDIKYYGHAGANIAFKRTSDIKNLFVTTCSRHTRVGLKSRCINRTNCHVPGGLADPDLVGDDNNPKWAYIDLGTTMPHPIGQNRHRVKIVSVLPLYYRKIDYDGTEIKRNTPTSLYSVLVKAVQSGSKSRINKCVEDIYWAIWKKLSGKKGLIQRYAVGQRRDLSGRFVIVPDPLLGWDECALPVESLVVFYGKEAADWLLKNKGSKTQQELLKNYTWPRRLKNKEYFLVYIGLKCFLEAHSSLRLLLNRQPSLHRYNIMAFRPVLPSDPNEKFVFEGGNGLEPESLVLRINPLVCASMGGDFDGDEMTIYVVSSEEKLQDEIKYMSPICSHNLLSIANNSPIATFSHDFILGTYLISLNPILREQFLSEVAIQGCPKCQERLAPFALWSEKEGREFMTHICKAHPKDAAKVIPAWMRKAFNVVTHMGVSFGIFDILHVRPDIGSLDVAPDASHDELVAINKEKEAKTKEQLNRIIDAGIYSAPGFHLAAMAISGARGDKQVRQLVAVRGFLSPNIKDPLLKSMNLKPSTFFFNKSLADGMTALTAWMASYNGRSSMIDKKLSTRQAGGLTRMLVLGLHKWKVKAGDCGSQESNRSPATCKYNDQKICSTCYGEFSDGTSAHGGFPAGYIAALSIGERGTQLSMQGFHTGDKAVCVEDIKNLLTKAVKDSMGKDKFLKEMCGIPAYKDIDPRHILLLWRAMRDVAGAGNPLNKLVEENKKEDLVLGLLGKRQWSVVKEAIIKKKIYNLATSDFGQIFLGLPMEDEERDEE